MTGQDYGARVTGAMIRATPREKREIARELSDHVEDRTAALAEAGMPLREAERAAQAAMGDPNEVAKALDAQLSPFWLWMGRGLKVCAAALAVLLAGNLLADGQEVFANLTARWGVRLYDYESRYERKTGYRAAETDVRVELGDGDVLRIYRVHVSPEKGLVDLEACRYDKNPFGRTTWMLYSQIWAANEQGTWEYWGVSNGTTYDSVWYMTMVGFPVEPGADHLDLECRTYGETVRFRVPLDGEVWE